MKSLKYLKLKTTTALVLPKSAHQVVEDLLK